VNESVIGSIPFMGRVETKQAIEAAERAQKDWAKKTAKERAIILRKWFTLMMENQEDLAQIMTAEQGKPLAESRGEIGYGASFIEFFAERIYLFFGEELRQILIGAFANLRPQFFPWKFFAEPAESAVPRLHMKFVGIDQRAVDIEDIS